jgi:EmrB/QacA subfamily drug resistance transporter
MFDTPKPATAPISDADRMRIIVGVLICMLLAALDQTIVAPVIPAIGAALGHATYISWIVSAYFLTATATTPLYGKIADIHGRRPTLCAAVAIFVAGSIMCALATSMGMLILGRAVQGLGGGGLMALAQTVIGDLFPPRERGKIAGYIAATWATASIAGPVLGGLITEHLAWPVIFWLNLPLAAIAVGMTNQALKRLPWHKRDHRLDLLGSLLVVLATVAFMLALALAPQPQFGWTSPMVFGLLAAGATLMPVLAWHLLRTPEPLIPLDVLGNRVVLMATFSVFFAMAAMIGMTVFVPLFLELVLGLTASQTGFALVGYMIGTVIGANFAGRTMARATHYKRLPLIGLALGSAGMGWLAFRAGSIALLEFEIVLILVGIGSGQQFPVTTVAVQNAVDPRDIGVATGVLAFMRALGSSIGVAVVGAVGAASGITANMGDTGTGATAAAAHYVAGSAFTPVFIAASMSLALGFVMLALMPARPLRGSAHAEPAAAAACSPHTRG